MSRTVFAILLCISVGLLMCAFSTRGKEGMFIFAVGAATLLCTVAVAVLPSKTKSPRTHVAALLGALVGLFLGGFIGASTRLGRLLISILNPDLPEHDFGTPFGAIGGAILGAFSLALLLGVLRTVFVRSRNVCRADCEQSSPNTGSHTA